MLLIISLTTFLYLGVNTWASSEKMMESCNENYLTIASFTYMGSSYPNENVSDKKVLSVANEFDYSLITDSKYTLSWSPTRRSVGRCEGYKRTSGESSYENALVAVIFVTEGEKYGGLSPDRFASCVVDIVYYGKKSTTERKIFSDVVLSDDISVKVEAEKTYVVIGEFFTGATSYKSFRVKQFDSEAARAAGVDTESIKSLVPINDFGSYQEFEALDDNIYKKIADYYSAMDNEIIVWRVDDLKANELFHEGTLYLERGRYFTSKEEKNSAKVCLITTDIAEKTGKDVGDKITMNMFADSDLPLSDCYWPGMEGNYDEEYEIVGVTNYANGMQNYMFVPEKKESDIPHNFGYTLGQAVIKNGKADEFLESLEGKLPDRMIVDVYDQGYAQIEESLKSIRMVSAIITGVSILAGIAVLILYAYLFISKQADTVQTMTYLGTPKKSIVTYMLFGSGVLALISSSIGSVIGYLLSSKVTSLAFEVASELNFVDLRYSNGGVGVKKDFTMISQTSPMVAVVVCLSVSFAALLLCTVFTARALTSKDGNKKDSVKRSAYIPKPLAHSSKLPGGAFKYSVLSLLRGGMRSVVVPIIAFTMIIFICTLTSTAASYKNMLTKLYDTTTIEGRYTSYSGKSVGGLVVTKYNLNEMTKNGLITDLKLSTSEHYLFSHIVKAANGEDERNGRELYIPNRSSYAYETLQNKVLKGSEIVFTNDFKSVPEFFYTSEVKTEFIDGYDTDFFANGEFGDMPCIVSTDFMAKNNVKLGDYIAAVIGNDLQLVGMKVVGSFVKEGVADNIYAPLPKQMLDRINDLTFLWGTKRDSDKYISPSEAYVYNNIKLDWLIGNNSYHSASFKLASTYKLTEMKEFLTEKNYSAPGHATGYRVFVVLNDFDFMETASDLNQQISYMEILYPLMYALSGVLGIVVSLLMINARKNELAVMRGVGTSKSRTFFSFFIEQAIACILGSLLAVLLWMMIFGIETMNILVLPLFALLYLAGSAIAIISLNTAKVLTILSDAD